jgi:Family of unknown function (DUF6159)
VLNVQSFHPEGRENETVFERISNSFALARSSWHVLKTDKKLVLFPMVSGIACLVVLASFLIPMAILAQNGQVKLDDNNQPPPWTWLVLFAFYFCNYFVIVFCNAALISCALMRFNGQEPTLGDGFRAAASRLPQIFAWALVSATVGILLKALENLHEKVGEVISFVLGTAWTVITYFVVPVLVVEKVGPFAAIGRSLQILRKAWGEALVGGIGLGLFKFLLFLPVLLLLIAGVVLLVMSAGAQPMLTVGLVVLGLGLVSLLVFAAVSAALDTIFLAALYQFAAFDKVPDGFNAGTMRAAFQHKQPA